MKRSEMIDTIATFLYPRISDSGYIPGIEATKLLKIIEKKGMLPPIIEDESFQMLSSGELTYAVHKWEDED